MEKIANYAHDSVNNEAPELQDYVDAGVEHVTSANLAAVNEAIDAATKEQADTTGEVQNIVDNVLATPSVQPTTPSALEKIANYADSSTNPVPELADYQGLDITGVSETNLAAVNEIIDGVTKGEADSKEEVQALITNAANKLAALEIIANYAHDNTGEVPTLATYQAAGIDGVNAGNVAAVNALVDAVERVDADTVAEVEGLIHANAVQLAAIEKIANYAEDSTAHPTPTLADYQAAQVDGVTIKNLAAVNELVDAQEREGADTEQEVEALITSNAARLTALQKIANYAESANNPVPTAEDYQAAGINNVDANNVDAVNAIIDSVTKPEADTTGEVQALVDGAANKLAALAIIADYAESNTNDVPTLQHYLDADIDGVNASNLAYVNTLVDAEEREGADTEAEVEALINTNKVAITAMEKIANYADSMSNPTPTLEDYTNAGITHALLTEATLAAVNELVEAQEREGADTPEEVLALLNDAGNKTTLDAIQKIANYAHDSVNNEAPELQDYVDAGVEHVTSANLAAVNEAIDAATKEQADTTGEVQNIVDNVLATPSVQPTTPTALEKIANYADSSTNPVPELADYQGLDITGVSETNLAAVNEIIDGVTKGEADSKEEVQALITNAANKLAALEIIANYAHDNTGEVPTLATYQAAGIDGVNAGNVAAVNALVDAVERVDADTVAEVEGLIHANAVQLAAIEKIANYAEDSTAHPTPTLADYQAAQVDGVTIKNLAAVNELVDAQEREGADTEQEVEALITSNAARLTALQKIANYAESANNPVPTAEDYQAAGINNVDANNVDAVNAIIDSVTKPEADTTGEVQALVDGAANKLAALAIIADYAESNTNDVPTLQHYLDADIDGVNASNLAYVNTLVDAEEREGADTEAEVEALINTNKVAITAMEKIANYADSMSNPTPTLEDYTNAGITHALLTEATLAAVNELVEAQEREGADTPEEVLALLNDAGNKTTLDAIQKIANYAHDSVNNEAPELQDYVDAGVEHVTSANLAAVNEAIDAATKEQADTTGEVQNIVDNVLATPSVQPTTPTALEKIANYADSSTNPVPELADYQGLDITGVSETNLAAVNEIIDGVTKGEADSKEEVQALITNAANKLAALEIIANYAHDNTGEVPTLATYQAAGIEGVNASNVAAVNALVDAVERVDADTVAEVEGLIHANAVKLAAIEKIANYAEDSTAHPTPTLADYQAAQVDGVTIDNIAAVNLRVDAEEREGADTHEEVQALVNLTLAEIYATAKSVIETYAKDGITAPQTSDYVQYGVTKVDDSNVAAINSAIDAQMGSDTILGNDNDSDSVDTTPKVQAIVDAYLTILATADGTADNSDNPLASDYAAIGVTDVNDDVEELSLLGEVIDGLATTDVDAVSEVQAYAGAVQSVMDAAAGDTSKPSIEELQKLGIDGLTADNMALVQAAIGNTETDGSGVDSIAKIQALVTGIVDEYATAKGVIETYAKDGITAPQTSDYVQYGVTKVDDSNVAAINSAIDAQMGSDTILGNDNDSDSVDTTPKVQAIVDAYLTILATADGTADNSDNPLASDYAAIGVTDVNDDVEELSLLGEVIDGLATTDVDAVSEVQAYADAVQSVMDAAAGDTSKPSIEELQKLGIDGLTADNMALVQAAIGNTETDGSGVDSIAKIQALVTGIVDEYATAKGVIETYAKDGITAPQTSDYVQYGVTKVDDSNVAAINSAIDAQMGSDTILGNDNDSDAVDTTPKVQAIVDAYLTILATADGTADNSDNPLASDYAAIGVTDVNDDVEELSLLGEVIDGLATTDVDAVSEVQAYAGAVQSVMDAAAGDTSKPSIEELQKLGIDGLTADNMALVQAAIGNTETDGTGVDSIAKIQALVTGIVDEYATAKGVIETYAKDGITAPEASDYVQYGVTKVDDSNVAAINSAIDAQMGSDTILGNDNDSDAVDTTPKVQAIVDAYLTILATADGTADNSDNPLASDYAAIGVTDVNDDVEELSLLGEVIDGLATTDVDAVSEVQAYADAVQSVMDAAAGDTSKPSIEELQKLGIDGLTADNMALVQAAIGNTETDGSGVDSIAKIQALVTDIVDEYATAKGVIETYAKDGITAPQTSDYVQYGVTKVDDSNVAAINSAIDAQMGSDTILGNDNDSDAVDTTPKVQAIVDAYLTILATADGTADNSDNPLASDYAAIGVTDVNDDVEELSLLGEVIDGLATTDVDAVSEVQAYAGAVQSVMEAAAGDASKPTKDELQKLGIEGVSAGNIGLIQAAITDTLEDGSEVDSIQEIQDLVNLLPPSISSFDFASTGGQNSYLNADDVLHITVNFTKAVVVNGNPGLSINIDGSPATAVYKSGSNSDALVFEYKIGTTENDADGISIGSDALDLNGATITEVGNGKTAIITHDAVADNGAFMVDTIAPVVSAVVITGDSGKLNDRLNEDDTVTVSVTFDDKVEFDPNIGKPSIWLNVGGQSREATYVSGGGSSVLQFTYTIAAEDNDSDGIAIDANSISLNGATVTDLAGNVAASLAHDAVANNSSYLVDNTSPDTTVVINSISEDTGISGDDFITDDNDGLIISATLSKALEPGQLLQYSIGGDVWTDISSSVDALLVTHTDLSLTASTTIALRVVDEAGNAGDIASQVIVIDTSAPEFTSGSVVTVNEGISSEEATYIATVNDESQVSYSLVGTADDKLFGINSATGEVTFKQSPDFENPTDFGTDNIYNITVRATDYMGNETDQDVAITVANTDEPAPVSLDLGLSGSFNMNLIRGYTTSAGKTYFYVDVDGKNDVSNDDRVTHEILDYLFNNGFNTVDTQPGGAREGVDDERTLVKNGYTLVLPTVAELAILQTEVNLTEGSIDNQLWPAVGNYWTSTASTSSNYHYAQYISNQGYGSSHLQDSSKNYVMFEVLYNGHDSIYNKVVTAAGNNTASSKLLVSDYAGLGVTGVDSVNLAAVNDSLDTSVIESTSVDTHTKLQNLVSSYQTILELADAKSSDDTAPVHADYANIGVSVTDNPQVLKLLGQVIDIKSHDQVDTITELQALAAAVEKVVNAATGGTAPSLAELHLLGLDQANEDNLESIQNAIAATGDGTKVDSLAELRNITSSVPATLDLSEFSSLNLNLINPIWTEEGKLYYYVDVSDNGFSTGTDTVTQYQLSGLLSSSGSVAPSQPAGALEGVDDQRTVIIDGYTLVLPTQAELVALYNQPGNVSEHGWASSPYWTADYASVDNSHANVYLTNYTGTKPSIGRSPDSYQHNVVLQVLSSERDAALEKVKQVSDTSDSSNNTLSVVDYQALHLNHITQHSVAAVNSVLDLNTITSSDVNTVSKIQTLFDSFNKVLNLADGNTLGSDKPSQSDFTSIGITGIDDTAKLQLLNQVLDLKQEVQVNSVTELQAIADAVQLVVATAAGTSSALTEADMQILGFASVTNANIASIKSAIAATEADGSGVDSVGKLIQLIDSTPVTLDLGTHESGVNLQLIEPITTQSGKVYYFLDVTGSDGATGADAISHALLDELFNAGSDTVDTQINGAVPGNDDARTVIIGGYTLVLPTEAELEALYYDVATNPPANWDTSTSYWSSTWSGAANYHSVNKLHGSSYSKAWQLDGESYLVALQVIDSTDNSALQQITSAAENNTALSDNVEGSVFAAAGVVGVSSDNIALLSSVLDSTNVNGEQTNSVSKVQDIVDTANALFSRADGVSSDTAGLSYDDYTALGINVTDDDQIIHLLGQAIDVKQAAEVATFDQVQALADAATRVILAASSNNSDLVSFTDLQLLGVMGVDSSNIAKVAYAIANTNETSTGTEVDSLNELRILASGVPQIIDIQLESALWPVQLIKPVITQDGSVYYLMDFEASNSLYAPGDRINHHILNASFGSGNYTISTQVNGAVEDIDDQRTMLADGYTIVLPTIAEFQQLANDALSIAAPEDWYGATYWAANLTGLNRYGHYDFSSGLAGSSDANTKHYVVVQVLSNNRSAALEIISQTSQDNNAAAEVTVEIFASAGIQGVTSDNLAAMNSALDSDSININFNLISTYADVKGVVDAYNTILTYGAGNSEAAAAPNHSDYVDIGLNMSNDTQVLTLVNQVVRSKSLVDLDSVTQLQAIVDAANNVMTGASGDGSAVSLTDLQVLGVEGVNSSNLSLLQNKIANTDNSGTGVDSLNELQLLSSGIASELILSDVGGLKLNLIKPVITPDGKVYYFVDFGGDKVSGTDDAVNHNLLNGAFNIENDGKSTTSSQPFGAVEGLDDTRTLISDGYTIVLPTVAELKVLYSTTLSGVEPEGWLDGAYYWAADQYNYSNHHNGVRLDTGASMYSTDTATYAVAVQVISSSRDAALEVIAQSASDNDEASNVRLSTFAALGSQNVTNDNLAAINSALDSTNVDFSAADSYLEVQGVIDGYNAILAHALGVSNSQATTTPSYVNYTNIGVNITNDPQVLKLLGQALQMKQAEDVSTVAAVQALVDAVENTISAAKTSDGSQVSLGDLELVGVAGVNSDNITNVQAAIASSNNDGTAVDTLSELRMLASDIPMELSLTDVGDLKLNLIKPVMTQDGKVYYFIDINDDGVVTSGSAGDQVTHDLLDRVFNFENGGTNTNSSQAGGAVEGVDGSRTLLSEGYTIILPTAEELILLRSDALADGNSENWLASSYWAAGYAGKDTGRDMHSMYSFQSNSTFRNFDFNNGFVAVQVLSEQRDAALATIRLAATENNAGANVSLDTYIALGIAGVTETNYTSINNALDTSVVANTYLDVQKVADAYNAILSHATGVSSAAVAPDHADYTNIGMTLADDAAVLKLLGQVIQMQQGTGIATVAQVQALADAVENVMAAAVQSDASKVSLDDLQLLGVHGVSSGNIATVQNAIANATKEGVDSLSELGLLANGLPNTLSLTETAGIKLELIKPIMTASGKVYYLLDHSGNGDLDAADQLDHNVLDSLFNSSGDTLATQSNGATAGLDDERTALVDGYTLILPTKAELLALHNDAAASPSSNWVTGYYQTADLNSADNHDVVYMTSGITSSSADTSKHYVVLEVIDAITNISLDSIGQAAGANAASSLVVTDYEDAGVIGVTNDNLNPINSILSAAQVSATDVDTVAKLQAIIDAYQVLLDAADGVADGDNQASQRQYQVLGLNGLDSMAELTLMGSIVDSLNASEINDHSKLDALRSGVVALLDAVDSSGSQVSLEQLKALGVIGVNESNIADAQSAVAGVTNGSDLDSLDKLQTLVTGVVNPNLAIISNAAQNSSASTSSPSVSAYTNAGIDYVDDNNLAALNSLLNGTTVTGFALNTVAEVQFMVDAYVALSSNADGHRDGDVALTTGQWLALGVTGIDTAAELSLLADVIDGKSVDEVDSLTKLQDIADAVQHFVAAAANDSSELELADFDQLGINLDSTNLQAIKASICGSVNSGGAIDSVAKLQSVVDSAPSPIASLSISTRHFGPEYDLDLIKPFVTNDGKIYYFVDVSANVAGSEADVLSGSSLNYFLEPSNTVNSLNQTQPDGAVAGYEDARAMVRDGYTVVVPNADELVVLFNESGSQAPEGWADGYYWAADSASAVNTMTAVNPSGTVTSLSQSANPSYVVLQIIAPELSDIAEVSNGDDEIQINASMVADLEDTVLDMGAGVDTLQLLGTSIDMDLTNLDNGNLQNIEYIDLTGIHQEHSYLIPLDNALTLAIDDVLAVTDENNVLKIMGDAGDSVDLTGMTNPMNAAGKPTYEIEAGQKYYVYSATGSTAELWIDVDIQVNGVL